MGLLYGVTPPLLFCEEGRSKTVQVFTHRRHFNPLAVDSHWHFAFIIDNSDLSVGWGDVGPSTRTHWFAVSYGIVCNTPHVHTGVLCDYVSVALWFMLCRSLACGRDIYHNCLV